MRRSRLVLLALCVSAVALIVGVVIVRVVDRIQNPGRVARMLNIPTPPRTLRVSDCESGAWTDVVIMCAVEIDPAEFPLLLKGYDFSSASSSESSYSVELSKIGPEFEVATEYEARPVSFKDGGSVRVLVDAEKRRAIVDLYVE